MSTLPSFDLLSERVAAGDRLSDLELTELSSTPDILRIGMLADAARRLRVGDRATYLRVASYACDDRLSDPIPAAAREIRITGSPATMQAALAAVERAKAAGGDRTIAGFSWGDVVRMAASAGMLATQVLSLLRSAGLDALVDVPLDEVGDPVPVLEGLRDAGFDQVRLTIERAPASERTALLLRAGALQERGEDLREGGAVTQRRPERPARQRRFRNRQGIQKLKRQAARRALETRATQPDAGGRLLEGEDVRRHGDAAETQQPRQRAGAAGLSPRK